MRVAIFSDVHGNLTGLEAVLAHIDRHGPDLIAFAGDLCAFGARPSACLDLVSERKDILSIFGNTDEWIHTPLPMPEDLDDKARQHWQYLQNSAAWTHDQLNEAQIAWLTSVPFAHRVSPTSDPGNDLLIVHANPQDVNQPIFPDNDSQQARIGKVEREQPDEALRPLLKDTVAAVIAFGHVHFPNVRAWQNMTLANISSVSLALDGDTRAKYGLLTWQKEGGWSVAHQFVPYDVEQERKALAASQPPNWEKISQQLDGQW